LIPIVFFVGETKPLLLGAHEEMQALVDDRSPNGLPKKPSCAEARSSTEKVEQSAPFHLGHGTAV